jgi:hypothetical protein
MKIEGMLSPLPVTRVQTRASDSAASGAVSEDAVYFEPEDKRNKNNQQNNSDSAKKDLAADVDILSVVGPETEPATELNPVEPSVNKKLLPRLIDVLA